MNPIPAKFFRTVVVAGLASCALLSAASADDAGTPRSITVTGDGEVKAVPDEATLSTGVVSEGRTAADALAANRDAMNHVFATLKKLGVPDTAIQTSDFSVSPRYLNDGSGNRTEQISGYRVSNTVSAILDDLGRLGPALDALVSSGSNSLGDVEFSIRDPKPLMAAARQAAMKDAIAKAAIYARAGGFQVGKILSVSEGGMGVPRPVFAMAKMAPASTPVAAGEQSVSASVSVTFQIR